MGSIKRKFGNNITSGKFDATDLTGTIPASNVANASLTSVTALPGISGDFIQTVASDPPAPSFGDVWYNSTEQKVKLLGLTPASWATGGSLSTARLAGFPSGAGTQTASFCAGGQALPVPLAATEEYDGSTWTAGGNLPAGKENGAGMGTLTAGLTASGSPGFGPINSTSEEYDGSSWAASNPVNTGRIALRGCGVQTAALAFGGYTYPPFILRNETEEYDGTSWVNSNPMNTARQELSGTGTQTAGLAFGGTTPAVTGATEEYDGTSWTTSPGSLNTARASLAGAGTQTAALAFGGATPTRTGATEEYDGNSWTTSPTSLNTVRSYLAGSGNTSAALAFGGSTPPYSAATEEYTGAAPVVRSIQGS